MKARKFGGCKKLSTTKTMTAIKKRRRWLAREREWNESRWDSYLRFWHCRLRWAKLEGNQERMNGFGDYDDDDATLVNSSSSGDGSCRRRNFDARRLCFEKMRRAYRAYCKRFETG
jgi:hypothetical protein